jgi:hypothetical protein
MILQNGKLYFGRYVFEAIQDDKNPVPQGRYKINFRFELTPLTKKYRKRYAWFTWHIQIDVPYSRNIYIHAGQTVDDSTGCLLVEPDKYHELYNLVAGYLISRQPLYLEITEPFC